jgi:hypothetical protein
MDPFYIFIGYFVTIELAFMVDPSPTVWIWRARRAIFQAVNTMDSMLALLVSDDPRRSADRILTRLIQIHQAKGGAILRPRQGQIEIWMSAGLALPAVAELPVRWADHHDALAAGRSVIEPGYALFPAMLGDEMIAALYLGQPEGPAVGEAWVFGAAIAQAVQAADETGAVCPRRTRRRRRASRCCRCSSATSGTSPRLRACSA